MTKKLLLIVIKAGIGGTVAYQAAQASLDAPKHPGQYSPANCSEVAAYSALAAIAAVGVFNRLTRRFVR